MKAVILCGLFLAAAVVVSRADDRYADSVISYDGTNVSSTYQNPSTALGSPLGSATISAPVYKGTNMVGIGNGGQLTVAFDTPIQNDPANHAYGLDFIVFGNEFFVNGSGGTISGVFNHPALTVWVSMDDISFYQLTPPPGAATLGADDYFPTQGSGDATLPINPAFTLSSFVGQTPAQALSLYNGSAGGAAYAIAWAEDADGNPMNLPSISYIRIVGGTSGTGYVDAISRVQSVPEPSSIVLVLLCAGLLPALACAKKRSSGPARIQAG